MRDTIQPKSDQLNADDLIGRTLDITVTGVKKGSAEQPIIITYEGDGGHPYKPSKSMRRVLVHSWGDDGKDYVGRSMRLYCNPKLMYGGKEVGGIQISHLSHIQSEVTVKLTIRRGVREDFTVQPMPDVSGNDSLDTDALIQRMKKIAQNGAQGLRDAWDKLTGAEKAAIKPHAEMLKEIAHDADNAEEVDEQEGGEG